MIAAILTQGIGFGGVGYIPTLGFSIQQIALVNGKVTFSDVSLLQPSFRGMTTYQPGCKSAGLNQPGVKNTMIIM